jgi:signal peptide peptidase SppA
VKHLAELSDAPWLMEPAALEALVARAQAATEEARSRFAVEAEPLAAAVRDGVATIEVRGVFAQRAAWWADGIVVTGEVGRVLEAVAADPAVRSIVMRIDSPGGQAAGIQDLADLVHATAQKKPVHAVVEGMAASAAYWVASQATSVSATQGSRVGSIGVYTIAVDASRMAENLGVKVHVVRSGPEKGVGAAFGAPITDAQLATLQASVDELAGDFAAAVARGRRLDGAKVKTLATGRTWRASDAVAAGLVDRVEPASAAMNRITTHMKERHMADQNEIAEARRAAAEEERARVRALNEQFADDPEFVKQAQNEGWTLEQASVKYIPVARERAKKAEQEAAKAKAAPAPKAAAAPAPVTPVPHGEPAAGGSGDFMQQARARAKSQGIKLTQAMKELAREDKALHEAFVRSQRTVPLEGAAERLAR